MNGTKQTEIDNSSSKGRQSEHEQQEGLACMKEGYVSVLGVVTWPPHAKMPPHGTQQLRLLGKIRFAGQYI